MKKKEKKRKKWRCLKWCLILPLLAAMLFFGLHSVKMERWNHENHRPAFTATSKMEGQAFAQKQERPTHSEGHMPTKHEGHKHGGYRHHERGEDGFFLAPFLLELGLLLSGWMLLRKSEGNTAKKWIGILLLVAGALPLLPVLVLAAVVIWMYKKFKKRNKTDWMADDLYSAAPTSSRMNILDEWEQNIRKEEK
ncbi:hypothetical protein ACFDTO_13485 [Microbacteriaceae bacterium 4G12]